MSSRVAQVRLLGPIDVTVGGAVRALAGLRRKSVLAVMGLHVGETVSIHRLIDAVWGQAPPNTAANTLQNHMSYLRSVLDSRDAIIARSPGYLLNLDPDAVDVARAERLIRQSRQSVDHALTAQHLRSALALWHGPSLADVTDVPWLREQAERLEYLRLDAAQGLVEARLALGEHAAVVPELESLAEQHPFREHLHRQLILALYRAGRQADALAAYQRLRHTIRAELGLDPSPALRELEAAILRQDATLDPPPAAITVTRATGMTVGVVPAQLPLAASTFVGRHGELSALDAVMSAADRARAEGTPAVSIAAVSGTAGVGKTTLAVQWAHRAASRFPDGQLYVNLRGFNPGAVMDPTEAIRGFLEAFGIPARRIPAVAASQAGLYRSVLANKRVLIVIDNARDDEHVRPLLPGAGGCLVVVTSRHQLTGLIATEGAQPLTLGLPSAIDAHAMLTRRLGLQRMAAEPATVADIIDRCARLPLALAITAARLATRPDLPLAALVGQLHDSAAALDPFRGSDPATDVRAVFSWSYRTLSADAARVFRYLSVAPGPDVGLRAVASLVDLATEQVQPLLDELIQIHLIDEPVPGRYTFHDLLRAYAAEQAARQDSGADRCAAWHRVLDHYLHTGYAAAMLLTPERERIALAPPHPGARVEPLADRDQATAWFAAELSVLIVAVGHRPGGFEWRGWQLAWTFAAFVDLRSRWHDNVAAQHVGLDAAIRAGDRRGQAHSHRMLAKYSTRLGRFDDADDHCRRAIRLFDEIGDRIAAAYIRLSFAWTAGQRADFVASLHHAHLALQVFEEADHRPGQAQTLNFICFAHAELGNFQVALGFGERALALFEVLNDRLGHADVWDSLGLVHFGLGDTGTAVDFYQRAIAMYREIDHVYGEGDTLNRLGDCYAARDDQRAARRAWRQSATILGQLEHRGAAAVRAKLGSSVRHVDKPTNAATRNRSRR